MLEEITNKDGFVTIFDEDGLITIQMSEDWDEIKKVLKN